MSTGNSSADVVIVGGGPAGRALATRCIARQLAVVIVDPHPRRVWTPTYSAWADELPSWLPDEVIASRIQRPSVWAEEQKTLDRAYCVLNTSSLQLFLSDTSAQFRALTARTLSPNSVACTDGTQLTGSVVVDARGTDLTVTTAQQTAFGVIVDRALTAPVLGGGEAWFMDWRRDNGTSDADTPSFLYAVPLDDERVLLEETCLVGRPALGLRELEARLRTRLHNRGCEVPEDAPVERVRFAVEGPKDSSPGDVLRFGGRGGLMHPGTGYSVATSLAEADAVAEAIADGRDPEAALWPRSAKGVAALRRVGLNALLTLDPAEVATFFDRFFDLPVEAQRSYLSDRRDAAATAKVMATLFRASPWRVRKTLMRAPFLR
ncbi:lycopene cyclase family protein [Rhodococcus sp. (in: high G+C Gram-positive bacteria)]|uniref:lycopene cyclase family protein n=1 Tax=Rhodococcus sp. TaxID=1831 RepID=UPI001A2E2AEE|nr:lycopene cyclase family protein [Rhodococcus sp. (in: high G+C Gram-positive bacteria)]MBJ7480678.1 lycopene cyclase family protein [Rhodococcus sp. (in: high G+C Gram-positive bacteria)]